MRQRSRITLIRPRLGPPERRGGGHVTDDLQRARVRGRAGATCRRARSPSALSSGVRQLGSSIATSPSTRLHAAVAAPHPPTVHEKGMSTRARRTRPRARCGLAATTRPPWRAGAESARRRSWAADGRRGARRVGGDEALLVDARVRDAAMPVRAARAACIRGSGPQRKYSVGSAPATRRGRRARARAPRRRGRPTPPVHPAGGDSKTWRTTKRPAAACSRARASSASWRMTSVRASGCRRRERRGCWARSREACARRRRAG